MRTLCFVPIFSYLLVACGDNPTTPDASSPQIATLHITADKALALVVFRDGVDAMWQPATMKTPTSFEAVVHGPYVVAMVCEGDFDTFITRQIGRTTDDSPDLDAICGAPPANRTVTGHMVQSGWVTFGPDGQGDGRASWNFQLSVPDGRYDLIALTDDGIEVRRGFAVSADLAVTPDVDVVQRGTPLTAVAFGATNAAAGEQLRASVLLDTAAAFGADVYGGPIATARVAPESVLVTGDEQTVSVQATAGTVGRSLRQPFRVGGNAMYTLPPAIGAIQWSTSSGSLVVTWADRPPTSYVFATLNGPSIDGIHSAANVLQLSARFLTATAITHATYATDMPGYKPEWKNDFTKRYHRQITFQSVANNQITTNWDTEILNDSLASTPLMLPRALREHACRAPLIATAGVRR
jgi:hypothetical protein